MTTASATVRLWERSRAVLLGIAGIVALAAVWELYKAVGPATGVKVGRVIVLPRTDPESMPHVWEMISTLFKAPNPYDPSITYGKEVWDSALHTLRYAALGWVLGVLIGFVLAVLMSWSRLAEAAMLPWIIVSQTVPLMAIAPAMLAWGQYLHTGSWKWGIDQTMVAIAAYLAFFPVAVGVLRGLRSPETAQRELMHVYGVGRITTLVKLQLPASVPYLLPALRLAATTAVIGAVVAETSTPQGQGIGALIMNFSTHLSYATPAKPWTPILGAVAIGLLGTAVVALIGVALRRYRRGES
jgi:NitT/TauT family transport system permease protein